MNKNALLIEGELTIFRAAELKPVLLADPAPTEIDLSGVTELDSAGVQLLMLAKRTALAEGHALRLVGHSAPVIEVFELLNVAGYFGDPLVMESRAKGNRSRQSSANTARGSNES
jgi:anti-anti-sigma regulatory factor